MWMHFVRLILQLSIKMYVAEFTEIVALCFIITTHRYEDPDQSKFKDDDMEWRVAGERYGCVPRLILVLNLLYLYYGVHMIIIPLFHIVRQNNGLKILLLYL